MKEFEIIYKTYFNDVFRYIRRLSGDEKIAEEVTGETFFKAIQAIDKFKGECDLRIWLCQIAKNYKNIFFFEESVEFGSISEHFGKMLFESGFGGNYKTFCVNGFVPHMKVEKAMKLHGLDRESMINAVKEALK